MGTKYQCLDGKNHHYTQQNQSIQRDKTMAMTPTERNKGKNRHDDDYIVQYTLTTTAIVWDTFVRSVPRGVKINDVITKMLDDEGSK